ncbi:MAG: molybdopterin-dependent oxidoreductase [Chitinophagaceae bacterium]|nr:molybdopterin-dependent oxidoreductase [Oligoflexus sp.]
MSKLETPLSAPHDSAVTHVQGTSEFVDDRAFLYGELHVGLVLSPHARARILAIDTTRALGIPGVETVQTHQDLSHHYWGTIFTEQPFLAIDEVKYAGEVVAVVGAVTRKALIQGIRAVQVDYELLPPILSVDEAIAAKSYIGGERFIKRGEAEATYANAPFKLEGRQVIRGAEHFYLENQAAIVYPKEDGLMEVHSSTQHPTETQHLVAEALGLQQNEVICIAKRLGGGFGGKETQAAPFAVYAALVARATGKPARIVLSKDEDMIITGKRNPFQIDYKVGFDGLGQIIALDAKLYGDGGAYADLSPAIMERAMLHSDNAYFIPNMRVVGQVCRTNYHSHTAFRGFGGPKGVALIEGIIEDIAIALNLDALDVRKLNCYRGPDRDVTHYGQKLENNVLPQLFDELEQSCDYRARREALNVWNQNPRNHPRGLSLTAVKFGISFTTRFLNQGNALINVHRDGTIQVSTGAVEMGQGVNSRIARLVADEFGLPLRSVKVMATSTEKNANTSPTAASTGTDLNGAAACVAAGKIKRRLAALMQKLTEIPLDKWASKTAGFGTMPEIEVGAEAESSDAFDIDAIVFESGLVYAKSHPDLRIPFSALVSEAYFNRISVSEYGHYKIADLGFNKLTGEGRAFLYFSQGVAASEVEVNQITGEVKVLRTDILMDLGRPINHALDVGQVAGAFIQGMGWVTTEALFYNAKGQLLSHAPSTYKIPSVHDIPRNFKIDLLENHGNHRNIKGTKAAGEPPLLLCFSVWNAIRDAIRYHGLRRHGRADVVAMPIPATAETILRALKPEAFAACEGL